MATIVASRYAVLSVDDDDDDDDEDVQFKKKKIPSKKPPVKPQSTSVPKPEGNAKKKKKPESTQQLKNNQNSSRNKTSNAGGSSKKKKEPSGEQWEEWKQKDAQFVEGNFKEDLSKAILLSKLDYEQNKDVYEGVKDSEEKKNSSKKNKKSQKVMSLSEFNNLGAENKKNELPLTSTKTEREKKKSEFFNNLEDDIKTEISKEHLLDKKKVKESNSQESLTLVLYKASIEKRDREIVQLKAEVERLNAQLKNVKTRNTKLCEIIANGEMKDKAEVLMEVERLQTIKDELSSEVADLHIQLQQERSKVRQLSAEHKNKDKNKKHHGNSSETQ